MNRPENTDPLRELLSDAVSDVEPTDSLETIRNRTKVTTMSSRRPWIYGVGGAVVATAATITAIAVAGNIGNDDSADPQPATSPSGQISDPAVTDAPSDEPSEDPSAPVEGETDEPDEPDAPQTVTVPVYYLGDTAHGGGLYREFTNVRTAAGQDKVEAALGLAVSGVPMDPDYRVPWPSGTKVDTTAETMDGDVIVVPLLTGATSLHDRPAGMSQREAELAIEQLVYTAQGVVGQGRLPVQFLLDGGRTDMVLGVPTSEPLANGPVLETLSLVNIDSPANGAVVTGNRLEVTGVANSFEANVVVRLQRYEGTKIYAQEPFTAEGWMEEKLFPFRGTLDISSVPPGKYSLIAMTDDPSGGAEGSGPDSDSKVITIE